MAMSKYKVEEFTEKDAGELSELMKEVWPKALEYPEEWRKKRTLSREQVVEEMKKGYHYFGVRLDGKIVGFYKLSIVGDACFGEHQTIHPTYRGRGLASAMYEQLIQYAKQKGCKRVFVNILTSQIASIKCVNKFGFKKKGEPYEQAKGMLVQMYEKEV
jgi:L-amino acid N-acyltransferase YncA